MATEITMPQLGESVTEGTITKWLVAPGDQVNKYDPIAEVMTDKVNAEVPSSYTGTINELIAEEDQTIEVGEVICTMNIEGGEAVESKEETGSPAVQQAESTDSGQPESSSSDTSSKKRYSPAVLRLAQENNIDLNQVEGSGRGGRITRKDLMAIIESGDVPGQDTGSASQKAPEAVKEAKPADMPLNGREQERTDVSKPSGGTTSGRAEEVPVSGVRKAIAQNMVKSKHEAPHAWMMIEVDVTDLVRFREKVKNEFQDNEGIKLTFLPFFMKAAIDALKKYPQVNAKWDGDKIIRYKDVHLSMAVATEEELFVPVIKHADEKNIKGLARELNDISRKVRSNSLKQEDMQGGTFTLNNTGSFGSVQSQPIINTPQAAILSVESIVKRPVVLENDAIAVRHMVNLCMSLDHRVLDGLICGKFMNHIKHSLENMNEKTVSIY
ncbi:2-oxo acid dehydrogenase subunit E2 [Salipaludibacillus sp. CUR1]|uniref:dihydrolipoamide acetyltransferase family protein n=1 Tax=Salipaludibacillus sp. CUR1 TaxID=2820003 RepID=UPI001E5DD103|nr:dihydrolipoamide acetyltransferase family protein [Salipaludibacillus sp. CUR1]MCE7794350.1 2-oxo acid dehydrogenase subunit E2 [Salipaludibacillus sp. CUR1]